MGMIKTLGSSPASPPPPAGPATGQLPAGNLGVGLDAYAQKRAQAFGKLQQIQQQQVALLRQYGPDGYKQLLAEAQNLAQASDAEYRQAAEAAGQGMFTERYTLNQGPTMTDEVRTAGSEVTDLLIRQ